MYVMWCLWWLLASAWSASAAAVELRCEHPLCLDTTVRNRWKIPGFVYFDFLVEGRRISIVQWEKDLHNVLTIDCLGWAALESPAMPRFTPEFVTSHVELSSCPPPKRPFTEVLAALNVNVLQNGMTYFLMSRLPKAPVLTELHFKGLESTPWLTIIYRKLTTDHVRDILGVFKNLRGLNLGMARIPITEFSSFRSTLRTLILEYTVVRPLPEMLQELSYLQNLTLNRVQIETLVSTNKNYTNTKTEPSALEMLLLDHWEERQMVPLEHCESLRYLQLKKPKVEQLPSLWVAACPRLERLFLSNAEQLATLPARLLDGAIGLKFLNMTEGALESLPHGFLEGAPNLLDVNLSNNRLRTISSDMFTGPALRYLSLSYNLLEPGAAAALAPLDSLTELDLGYNPSLTDLCDQDGYSNLVHLTQLRQLSLAAANISRICTDWRVNMSSLIQLDLRGTRVEATTEIEFIAQARGILNEAKVLVGPAPIIPLFHLWKKQKIV